MSALEKVLLQALDMLTEGKDAPVTEALRPEAAAVQKAARPWTKGRGIQGLGIAKRITAGKETDELALKVYVERKLPKSKCSNLAPSIIRIAGLSRKIPTDVEEIGKVATEPNTSRVRPAVPGFGVGHLKVSVGTFGCLVQKKGDKKGLYILSNSHILANQGVAKVGDVIIQPGRADGGRAPRDVIARLNDWVPFQFTASTFPNLVDAAIAKVKSRKLVTSAIRLIGVPKGVSKTVRIGIRVQKTGRTTDHTHGIIKDVNYRLFLNYKKPGGGTGRAGLRDQVLCTRYTAGGDSGSAVLNMQNKVVGLHFAGSPSTSIFNRIGHVLDLLGIVVVTKAV